MAVIQVCGAGGAPSNNFIRSLRESRRNDFLVGTSCVPSDLFLADVDEKYVVPPAQSETYAKTILSLIGQRRPDFLHAQNDFEVRAVSRIREKIAALGTILFLPGLDVIENCVDKWRCSELWKASGVKVPKTILLKNEDDLRYALTNFGEKIWIRAKEGAAGLGALPTNSFDFAKCWVDQYQGWGKFTASELLTDRSVTWQSIWFEGELVVAQTRARRSWSFGSRTVSGVTGITGVGVTCSIPIVDQVSQEAIFSVDKKPHGIFSVDLTYDNSGFPNPTEINIGRFFTTHYFFTKAGLNFPEIYCDIALEGKFPVLTRKINPLPDGLVWIRGMDREPVLTTAVELEKWERNSV